MSLLRGLAIFKLGALAGAAGAAAFVKRTMPSRGDEESDELGLVAVFDGIELTSRARAFRGGSLLAWFGGIEVDMQAAELASGGARLSVNALLGGIELKVPPTWKVESHVKVLLGGVETPPAGEDDEAAPVLSLTGMAVLGGIEISSSRDAFESQPTGA